MITAPYNFVPLSDKVVSPYWAKLVSHDIPFKDSQSGVLDLTIRAESPIYVRNGVPKNATDSEKNAFNKFGSDYFIPGSSIKGMLRSVMEIMSFGRMGNKVNDHKYSVRDFQNNDIYPKSELAKKSLCGWLSKKNEKYYLKECGKPGRISHKTLDALCNKSNPISAYYKNAKNITKQAKSAKSKYDIFPFNKEGHKFKLDYTDVDRPIYKIDDEGISGEIVFSGQPGVRNEPIGNKASGKHLEFIFFNYDMDEVVLDDSLIHNFFFAYYDHDLAQQKDDWKWRKSELEAGKKIPVFFRKNQDGSIKDMGLTLLYKITYENSIKDSVIHQQGDITTFDLAETIFGYTEDKNSLKGRVHIGHAFVNGDVTPLPEKEEVLAGPKASYYPNYIEQSANDDGCVKEYNTFMDDNARIRGWKRYPVRADNNTVGNTGAAKVSSKFIPLPSGTTFSFKIHYHNLRKEELGALISAITFHNTAGLYHSIGSGKPLGYGKVSVMINNISDEFKLHMLKAYEIFMDYSLRHSTPLWFQLTQIKELFLMAKPGAVDNKLKYMEMQKQKTGNDPLDFVTAKQGRLALLKYSAIASHKVDVTSLISEDELKEAKVNYDKEKAFFDAQQDIDTLRKRIIEEKGLELQHALEVKKKEWLSSLNLRRQEIADKELQEKKELEEKERRDRAASGLPAEWEKINDFGNLANRIPAWQKKLPNQVIPEAFQNDLVKLFKKIIQYELTINKKKKDWDGDFDSNKNYKRIAGWVGVSLAMSLFKDFNKNLN